MNAHKALKKARAVFGDDGYVQEGRYVLEQLDEDGALARSELKPKRFLVGIKRGQRLHLAGVGATWEEAFADAAAKKTRYQENKHG